MSDWSSDVCSSDLRAIRLGRTGERRQHSLFGGRGGAHFGWTILALLAVTALASPAAHFVISPAPRQITTSQGWTSAASCPARSSAPVVSIAARWPRRLRPETCAAASIPSTGAYTANSDEHKHET